MATGRGVEANSGRAGRGRESEVAVKTPPLRLLVCWIYDVFTPLEVELDNGNARGRETYLAG